MGERKVALITGSSRGIGKGCAEALAAAGYDIALHYVTSAEVAEETQKEIEALGVDTCLLHGDTGDPDVPARLVKETVEKLGRLDVLVSSAGFTRFERLLDIKVETIDSLYQVDFRGMILMAQAAARHFVKESVQGVILFNTSIRSFQPHPGDGVYGALKAGMNRIIQSFALELGPMGIRVNGFSPGVTNVRAIAPEEEAVHPFWKDSHRYIPLRRNGYPKDMGNVVAWLASDAANYITGQVIRVDGGISVIGAPESLGNVKEYFDIDDYLMEDYRGDIRFVPVKKEE